MQIWIDLRGGVELPEWCEGHDGLFGVEGDGGRQAEVHVLIDSREGQDAAIAAVGSVDWLFVECSDWEMIPVENIVAAADSTPTRIAALVDSPESVPGIAFALDLGVDALVIAPRQDVWEAALIARAQRSERAGDEGGEQEPIPPVRKALIELSHREVTAVEPFGAGDRICVDVTRLLDEGQGMLIGSQAGQLALVHAESIESEYVAMRPFRVNAGAVHSYILLADGSTRYLSELTAGDEVLLAAADGSTSSAVIGRLKLERRPLICIRWQAGVGAAGQVVLQQAETARVLTPSGLPVSVTKVRVGDRIIILQTGSTRHLGRDVSAFSAEY